MNEWLQILTLIWCAFLFPAGGTDLKGKGYKALRRYLMPFGLSIVAANIAPWWQVLGYTITLSYFLHLGYGDKATWLYRVYIFTGYGISSLWFGLTWWPVITMPGCLILFYFSNLPLTRKSFGWKICESGMGWLIAAGFISALLNQWRGV